MTDPKREYGDPERLESLWAGQFGDEYNERNARLDERRAAFWTRLIRRWPIRTVLEVGCGQGANLKPICSLLAPADVHGVDVNKAAVDRALLNAQGANIAHSVARALPFPDDRFDLVFTAGVLIHQPDETLTEVMAEVVRCSRRFVLWGEYHAPDQVEVPYRGQTGALFKRDYGRIYREVAPDLQVRDEGFLPPEEGFDNLTWQLLERG